MAGNEIVRWLVEYCLDCIGLDVKSNEEKRKSFSSIERSMRTKHNKIIVLALGWIVFRAGEILHRI